MRPGEFERRHDGDAAAHTALWLGKFNPSGVKSHNIFPLTRCGKLKASLGPQRATPSDECGMVNDERRAIFNPSFLIPHSSLLTLPVFLQQQLLDAVGVQAVVEREVAEHYEDGVVRVFAVLCRPSPDSGRQLPDARDEAAAVFREASERLVQVNREQLAVEPPRGGGEG